MPGIGERIREERDRLKMTQAEFAEACGVKRTAQFNYETGNRLPDAAYLVAARGLGVDVEYVLFGSRQGDGNKLGYVVEVFLIQLFRHLEIPLEQLGEVVSSLHQVALRGGSHYYVEEENRVLVGHLLQASRIFNRETKVLELDRYLLVDIIDSVDRHLNALGRQVSPTQKALRIASLYQMFSEAGRIDSEMLEAAARSIPSL